MPIFIFDPDLKQAVISASIDIHKSFVKYDMTKEATYKNQRGKDAIEVNKTFNENMLALRNGESKSRTVGNMVAEYQALSKRQKDHNAFWRFFHKQENIDRNNLLAEMKNAIKNALPEGMKNVDLDKVKPAEVARELVNARIRGKVEIAGSERMSEKGMMRIYGCKAAVEAEPPVSEVENFLLKEPMNRFELFMNDISDKSTTAVTEPIQAPLKNEKVPSKDGDDFRLF